LKGWRGRGYSGEAYETKKGGKEKFKKGKKKWSVVHKRSRIRAKVLFRRKGQSKQTETECLHHSQKDVRILGGKEKGNGIGTDERGGTHEERGSHFGRKELERTGISTLRGATW